jgi:hypothetical protein
MKKIILSLFICFLTQSASAQMGKFPKNEVKFNLLNVMIITSVEIGYERFLDSNQSIEGEFLINDRYNYKSDDGSDNFNTNSLKVGYVYYFGERYAGSGIYANPFVKYRFGDYKEGAVTTDMNAFIVGFGVGYKWNNKDRFIMAPYANIGRNFSKEVADRFSPFDYNFGFSVGYRF